MPGCRPTTSASPAPARRADELERGRGRRASSINMESEREMRRIARDRRGALGAGREVAVRVNPDFELKTSGMKMAGGPKQFGVDAERVPRMLAGTRDAAARVLGLSHLQRLAEPAARAIVRGAATTAVALAHASSPAMRPRAVRLLNLGGGFGIPYFPGEQPLDLAPDRREPRTRSCARSQARCRRRAVVLELGRYLVGESGVYVCRVIDRKISRGAGLPGHRRRPAPPPRGVGQLRPGDPQELPGADRQPDGAERARDRIRRRPAVHAARPARRPHGPGARPRSATWSLVFQSGAYGLTASPRGFLSHTPARAPVPSTPPRNIYVRSIGGNTAKGFLAWDRPRPGRPTPASGSAPRELPPSSRRTAWVPVAWTTTGCAEPSQLVHGRDVWYLTPPRSSATRMDDWLAQPFQTQP